MLDVQLKDIRAEVKSAFYYLVQRTWKFLLPLIIAIIYLDQQIITEESGGFLIFFNLIVRVIQACMYFYLPFKILKILDGFYRDLDKKYLKKRLFLIVFVYIFLIICFIGIYSAIFYMGYRDGFEISNLVFIVWGVLVLFFWIVTFFLQLLPTIYWGHHDITLFESARISIRGVKKYFSKILFFTLLIPILWILGALAIFMFAYFSLSFPIVRVLESSMENFGTWIYISYLSVVAYIFANMSIGKNTIFPQDREKESRDESSIQDKIEKEIAISEIDDSFKRLKMIVCVGENNLIGDKDPTGNGLLWHSQEELLYYKSLTVGQVTLFGKNTASCVPIDYMRKTREVILLSRDSKIEDILGDYPDKNIFICGGGTIYRYYLEKYPIAQIYVSKLKANVKVAEAKIPLYFPNLEELGYEIVKETEYEDFTALVYEKKKMQEEGEGI